MSRNKLEKLEGQFIFEKQLRRMQQTETEIWLKENKRQLKIIAYAILINSAILIAMIWRLAF
jgi:hypothetical protein